MLTDYAARSIGGHTCAVFADLGGSRRRYDLDAAFTDAQAGRFDALLVHSVNDLTGAPRLRQIVERFQAASVTVRSVAEQFDSGSRLAAFWMDLIDADNAIRQQRSSSGIEHAARRGTSRPRRPVGRVVTVQALYAAVCDERAGGLDELLIAAGAVYRCGCTATAGAGEPCPICGAGPAVANPAHTDIQKGQ